MDMLSTRTRNYSPGLTSLISSCNAAHGTWLALKQAAAVTPS